MNAGEIVGAVAAVVLLAAAAVLAVAETALTHLGRGRAVALAEEGRRGAGVLVRLLEHRERVLNPILLVLLTCHLAIATIVAVVVERRFGLGGLAVAFVIELAVIFVLAEAVPKTYALLDADRAATFVAPLVRGLALIAPLRWITRGLIGMANVIIPGKGRREGPTVSEEELLALAGVAAQDAVIDVSERALIERTIEFGDTVVREVMVPRPDMITVSGDFRVSDVIEVVILNGYSRLPVTGEGVDDIVGIVYAKDLMRAERDGKGDQPVTTVARPAHFVPETKRVAELLREMQSGHVHIAVVVDEYGGTSGLVTLEDLIEELVGEIVDEYDVDEAAVESLPDGDLRVNARMNIDQLAELLDAELPDGDWDSVGGLMFSLLGHVPVEGETVDVDGVRLRADRVTGRRISRVRISRLAEPPSRAGGAHRRDE
ncbi:MAG: hemolysin family protein [Acidimicrobiales bacterium]